MGYICQVDASTLGMENDDYKRLQRLQTEEDYSRMGGSGRSRLIEMRGQPLPVNGKSSSRKYDLLGINFNFYMQSILVSAFFSVSYTSFTCEELTIKRPEKLTFPRKSPVSDIQDQDYIIIIIMFALNQSWKLEVDMAWCGSGGGDWRQQIYHNLRERNKKEYENINDLIQLRECGGEVMKRTLSLFVYFLIFAVMV